MSVDWSLVLSGISIFVAIWQTVKIQSLKNFLKSEAMELYTDTGLLLGNTQGCLRELHNNHSSGAVQEAGKAEGMAQSLFNRSIKNIYHQFSFSRSDVEAWISKGKIEGHHKNAFLKYAKD